MADQKKLSVAEILAAARKSDSQGGAEKATEAPVEGPPADGDAAPAEAAASAKSEAGAAPAKPAKSASGGRMSVAEMMAAARAEKAAGGAKPTTKPTAAKAAPAKPAPAAKPAAAKAEAPAKSADRDTTSILAAARKGTKPGPMSKAEAAAKAKSDPDAAPAKPRIVVPPIPEKPAYAKASPAVVKQEEPVEETRRDFLSLGFWMVGLVSLLWTFATVKFMFPNVRREPPSKFKVGFPDAFPPGQVSEKYKAQFGVWVANAEYNGQQEIYALKSVCTHLGCTPNWLEAEQKFKCPCHGSGFYKDGINFEGPAPRPLERYAIRIAEDGQIEIDKSKTFQEEMGAWADPSCFIPDGQIKIRQVKEQFQEEMGACGLSLLFNIPFSQFQGRSKAIMGLGETIRESQLWKSVFRHPMPVDRRNRIVVMLTNFFLHLHPVSIKKQGIALSYTWCMGGVTFFLFLVETVTGVLLMFYYRPTVEWAYTDIQMLRDVHSLGIMREIHRWGAHAMVITVWLHMYRVFLTGSYKPPREFNWVVGVFLLLLTLLLSFTGYLLPWDQLAVWAITVGSNMARATPFLGHEGPGQQLLTLGGVDMITNASDARFALLGAREVGEETLNRFYILHCIAIPLAVALLLAIHFWRVRKDGGISGPL